MHHGTHPTRGPLRALSIVLRLLTALALLFATLLSTLALSISSPTSVNEGQSVSVGLTGPGTLAIAINGNVVAQGSGTITHVLPTNGTSAGLYTYAFTSTDPAQTNETRTIEIVNVPLQVNVNAPTANEMTTTSVPFSVSTNWPAELCYVTIDGASHALSATSPTTFSDTFSLSEGVHSLVYKCKLGSELPSVSRSLLIDSTPPAVLGTGPSGEITGSFATLTVDTDEIAQCKYGESDVAYAQLPSSMGSTYALRSTVTIPMTEQGSKTYFVRCSDVYGNAMQTSSIISFLARLAPTADISLVSADEPLGSGTYTLKLTTNVPLLTTPTLTYVLQDSGKTGAVILNGKDDVWEGIVTIPESTEDSIIQFTFKGTSQQNVIGTEITDGGSFKIDALAPPAVDALTATQTTSGIRLTWFMRKEEEGMTYNIYRADHERVEYTDLLATSRHLEYTDTNARTARYYYYRIAAVDKAGNIGPLSTEVWGSQIDTLLAETTIDPIQLAQIDDEITALTAALIDANKTIDQLSTEAEPIKASIITDMGLIDQAREARASLESALSRLQTLRSAEQFDSVALEDSRSARDYARTTLIGRIVPESQIDLSQPYDEAALTRNLPYALSTTELSKRERTEYEDRTHALNQEMTVTVHARSFSMWSLAGVQRDVTLVRKEITLDTPQVGLSAIEVIPKEVAASVSEITFSPTPTVLEEDPVVRFTIGTGERETYTYILNRIVPMDSIRASRTLLYPGLPQAEEASEQSSPTGLVIGNLPTPSLDTVLIAVAILIVLGLAIYYMSISRPKSPFHGLHTTHGPAPRTTPTQARREPARPVVRVITRRPLPQTPTPSDPRTLLAEAELQIDEKNYDASLASYRDVIAAIEQDADLHRELDARLVRVYKKLMLFKHLDEARRALDKHDATHARTALEQAKQLAREIGEEPTKLSMEAAEAFSSFLRSLNALEIERTGVY